MGKKSKMKAQVGKKRVSELTLNNIFYFARKYKSAFTKLLVISEDGARPILYLADNITRLLCDLFQVGNRFRIDENSESFQPLCFHYFERFLEELFCISMTLFDKTRREMKVKVDSSDYFVVCSSILYDLLKKYLQLRGAICLNSLYIKMYSFNQSKGNTSLSIFNWLKCSFLYQLETCSAI